MQLVRIQYQIMASAVDRAITVCGHETETLSLYVHGHETETLSLYVGTRLRHYHCMWA